MKDKSIKSIVLVLDVGNTAISVGIMKECKVLQTYSVLTKVKRNALRVELVQLLDKIYKNYPTIQQAIVCSVVPQMLTYVLSLLRKYPYCMHVVGQDFIVPIKNRYLNSSQVGQDRLVGAYAAKELYGFPAIVIDLGTATTFDIVSSKKEYLGGIILPGMKISLDALAQNAALLPLVEMSLPNSLIGKDTRTSILSGIYYGHGEMIRGILNLLSKKIKKNPYIILTGGYTHLYKKYVFTEKIYMDEYLVFKGLYLLCKERVGVL